jgi:hypothetical protein
MDTNTFFEITAETYRLMTGRLAPGKDAPAAAGPTDQRERERDYSEWCLNYGATVGVTIRAVENTMGSQT